MSAFESSAAKTILGRIEVEEDVHSTKIAFLYAEIYQMEVDLWVERLSACERFKA